MLRGPEIINEFNSEGPARPGGPSYQRGPTEMTSWSPAHVLAFPVKRLAPVAMGDFGMAWLGMNVCKRIYGVQ